MEDVLDSPPGEDGPVDLLTQCGCDHLLGDLVLPPYWFEFCSVLLLTVLSLLIAAAELHWKHYREFRKEKKRLAVMAQLQNESGCAEPETELSPVGTSDLGSPHSPAGRGRYRYGDRDAPKEQMPKPTIMEAIRSLAGVATLSALASPPWFLVGAQVTYHVAHFGYIAYQAIVQDVGVWGRYTLVYAEWVNGGAGIFLVFVTAGAWYTRKMIEGQQQACEEAADPQAALSETVDRDNFRKAYLAATDLHDVEALCEEKKRQATMLGDRSEWNAGYRTKLVAASVLAAVALPAVCTHVLPGVCLWMWVFGPIFVAVHMGTEKFIVRRARFCGLVARIVALDAVLALYSVSAQEAFNMALIFYEGENYFSPLPRVMMSGRSTGCWTCALGDSLRALLHTLSFA